MTISAADPLRLPGTPGSTIFKEQIQRPNAIKLTANVPAEVPVPKPAFMLITGATLPTVTAFPGTNAATPATFSETYAAIQVGAATVLLYFHAPGIWTVTSTVASTSAALFDAYDGITPILRALKAVSIIGASGLSPDSGLDSTFHDATLSGLTALNTRALIAGRNVATTGAGVLTVDRLDSIFAQAANGLFGMVAASAPMYPRETDSVYRSAVALQDVSSGGCAPGGYAVRADAYWSARSARRFTLARKDGGLFQSASAFSATDPQVLCVAPATNEWMIRRIVVEMSETNAGNTFVYVVVDPDNRYSAGGTSFIPTNGFQNTNRGVVGTLSPTNAVFDDGATAITASAADDDEWYSELRVIPQWGANGGVKNSTVFEFADGLIVPPSGTILIYVWNGTAEVDGSFGIELESANVQ